MKRPDSDCLRHCLYVRATLQASRLAFCSISSIVPLALLHTSRAMDLDSYGVFSDVRGQQEQLIQSDPVAHLDACNEVCATRNFRSLFYTNSQYSTLHTPQGVLMAGCLFSTRTFTAKPPPEGLHIRVPVNQNIAISVSLKLTRTYASWMRLTILCASCRKYLRIGLTRHRKH